MRPLVLPILLLLPILPVACHRSGDASKRPETTGPRPRETAFGHMGKVRSGAAGREFEGRVPFYRDGDLWVCAPVSGYPGKPLSPAYALLTRLDPGAAFHSEASVGSDGDSLEISPAQLDSKGRLYRFQYRVSGKPLAEAFSAGGRSYPPEGGRVFLLDLTADPPSLAQVPIDLTGVMTHTYQDPTDQELKAGVQKLAERSKAVRDFLERIEKK